MLRIAAILTLFIGQVAVYACLGPENVFGIRLNNGESIDVEALAEYRRYAAMYPNGKYEEDALYWIIRLIRASRDVESAARLKKTYLQKYPCGRWIEQVREID